MSSSLQRTIIDAARKDRRLVRLETAPESFQENDGQAYREAVEYLLPLIGCLPAAYADPLRLSDVEGMKQAEIARRMNLGISATKSRIQRAREMLRELFAECCDLETDGKGRLLSFAIKPTCRTLQAYQQAMLL